MAGLPAYGDARRQVHVAVPRERVQLARVAAGGAGVDGLARSQPCTGRGPRYLRPRAIRVAPGEPDRAPGHADHEQVVGERGERGRDVARKADRGSRDPLREASERRARGGVVDAKDCRLGRECDVRARPFQARAWNEPARTARFETSTRSRKARLGSDAYRCRSRRLTAATKREVEGGAVPDELRIAHGRARDPPRRAPSSRSRACRGVP